MTNSSAEYKDMQLLRIIDGKYHVKVKNVEIPIVINKTLYYKWLHNSQNIKTVIMEKTCKK
jgi:hypothetical protein